MSDICEICGRTQEEVEAELEGDFEITKKDDESVWKCGKCRKEYNRENGNLQDDGNDKGFDPKDQPSSKNWKDEVIA